MKNVSPQRREGRREKGKFFLSENHANKKSTSVSFAARAKRAVSI
jgi:hypothetical protein